MLCVPEHACLCSDTKRQPDDIALVAIWVAEQIPTEIALFQEQRDVMTVTLTLPPDVEREFLAEAEARGVSLDDLVQEVLIARATPKQGSFSPRRPRLWEPRKDLNLGDVSIKELITEGRE
jgi:hypothetical protein